QVDANGKGYINVLAADKLMLSPQVYSTLLLWLLSELFERLPEAGDLPKPKLVFFFDEAHLLFDDAPDALLTKIEQVVRLIRSKGVGVYFVTQNPIDIPDTVLAQCGNKVQHALRAFTPRDQKAVKAAAETFVPNPKLKVAEVIGQLGVGEALASTLREGGVPSPVERVLVVPPCCRIGAITDAERATVRARSPVGGKYDTPVERESAAEMLARRAQEAGKAAPVGGDAATQQPAGGGDWSGAVRDALLGTKRRQGLIEAMGKSAVRSVGSQLGRQIMRGVLGSIFRGR
ncbi:MAG: DUF853 domain-containing protein, partial [Xanthomonadaceae bacterium]|nr:DUF853 domain-containing protein [Xanthomonadaceae bacterium]